MFYSNPKPFLWLACLALIVACTEKKEEPNTDEKVTLSAIREDNSSWSDGETVYVNGIIHKIITDAENARIAHIEDVAKADSYKAVSGISDTDDVTENEVTFEISANHSGSDIHSDPLVASGKSETLVFKHTLGTLNISIEGNKVLDKLVLAANGGEKLSGKAHVSLDFKDSPFVVMDEDASAQTVLTFTNGLELSTGGTDISVNIPAGSYSQGFTCTLFDKEGGFMTGTVGSVNISRGETSNASITYEPGKGTTVNLSCSVENGADGTEWIWKDGQTINVNGQPVVLSSGAGSSKAIFGPLENASEYYAGSPFSAIYGMNGNIIKVSLPSSRNSTVSLQDILPIVASSSSEELSFKYVNGFVKVNVKGPHSVVKAQLKSNNDQRISGRADVTMSGDGSFSMEMAADASKESNITFKSAQSLAAGYDFVFPVPSGSYTSGMTLILTDAEGANMSWVFKTLSVERNAIAAMDDIEWSSSEGKEGNLSQNGWANCYMVHKAGDYSFSTKQVDGTAIDGISSADWLWATKVSGSESNELISDVKYADGTISFTASDKKGNALIAAFDENGTIVWSWHIWMTDKPSEIDFENIEKKNEEGYFTMDRNLGATSAEIGGGLETYGLLYQWGRKDPFYCGEDNETADTRFANAKKATVLNTKYSQAEWKSECGDASNGTIKFAIQNPMYFLCANTTSGGITWLAEGQYPKWDDWDSDWCLWKPFRKEIYDPCPPGYEVPRDGHFMVTQNSAQQEFIWEPNPGLAFTNSKGDRTWFPLQGHRGAHPQDLGALLYGGKSVNSESGKKNGQSHIWTSSMDIPGYSPQSRSFQIIYPMVSNELIDDGWANGLAVRCVRNYSE